MSNQMWQYDNKGVERFAVQPPEFRSSRPFLIDTDEMQEAFLTLPVCDFSWHKCHPDRVEIAFVKSLDDGGVFE